MKVCDVRLEDRTLLEHLFPPSRTTQSTAAHVVSLYAGNSMTNSRRNIGVTGGTGKLAAALHENALGLSGLYELGDPNASD